MSSKTLPPRISRSHGSREFVFSSRHERTAQAIFFLGWAITLLYFPSGMLHYFLSGNVYFRDGLMILHLAASFYFLKKCGLLARLVRHVWWLAIPPLIFLPAAANPEYTIEALTFVKWVLLWIDWIILGFLGVLIRPASKWLTCFCVATGALILADALSGLTEFFSNEFLFPMAGQKSALGVNMSLDTSLGKIVRVRGLQRDVFSFANLMAASAVAGLVLASVTRTIALRWLGWGAAALFATMLFISGGRSAFFGVAAALGGAIAYQRVPHLARRYCRYALAAWLALSLAISLYGIGSLTDAVSQLLLKGNRAGDSRSAFMRDANWDGITSTIADVPVVLLSGAPIAALADTNVAPIFHWADNEYLWFFYHVGIPGAMAVFFFFFKILHLKTVREGVATAMVLFLAFIMGEGIARESLAFLGCLPLFVSIGALVAPQTGGRGSVVSSRADRRHLR